MALQRPLGASFSCHKGLQHGAWSRLWLWAGTDFGEQPDPLKGGTKPGHVAGPQGLVVPWPLQLLVRRLPWLSVRRRFAPIAPTTSNTLLSAQELNVHNSFGLHWNISLDSNKLAAGLTGWVFVGSACMPHNFRLKQLLLVYQFINHLLATVIFHALQDNTGYWDVLLSQLFIIPCFFAFLLILFY